MDGNVVHFEIEAVDRIVVTRFESWECRGECALEFLCDLVQNWPELLIGRSGGISFGDLPPDPNWSESHELPFSATKHIGRPSKCLPFPCPYTLRWPQVGIPNAETMMSELLAADAPYEDDRMFWIGANTHPSRVELCRIGRANPRWLDTELMEWDPTAAGGQRSKSRQVSIPDHAKYKYLIDCEGGGERGGYSARIKWLMATGRPLFLVQRQYVEHWHEDLRPWVHYVPVKADLSDLLDHREKLEGDPELYASIGRNARRFAAENLTVEALLHRSAEGITHRCDTLGREQRRIESRVLDPGVPLPVIAVHSSNLTPLYENFVRSLDPDNQNLRLVSEAFDLSSYDAFGFQSDSWYRMLAHKIEFTLKTMECEIGEGDYFIVSDVDIHFFRPREIRNMIVNAAAGGTEFAGVLDDPERRDHYNGGFLILRKCPKIAELYERTLEALLTSRRAFGDQDEINRLIPELGIKHRPLPEGIGVLGRYPVHEHTVFYHATQAGDIEAKLARIQTARDQMRNRTFGVWQTF